MPNRNRVCVVVLGDIGRSPRMQYHVSSLLKVGYVVDVLGFSGSKPLSELCTNESVKFHFIWEVSRLRKFLPSSLSYILKASLQAVFLVLPLIFIKRPSAIFVQNPPSIPTLLVGYIVSRIRNCNFVIDWHNYGYSILALNVQKESLLVRIARRYERTFGRLSDHNLCVTKSMKEDLKANWNIEAVTHYDRPPLRFAPTSLEQRHKLFCKLSSKYEVFKSSFDAGDSDLQSAFTLKNKDGKLELREDRPALVVSSTSWTDDEDFNILIEAFDKYEKNFSSSKNLPKLVCAITGKGPMKEYYLGVLSSKEWKHVQVCTPWLENDDYPLLLGSADLGICLHTSSSGLDLPMKVVDMFGCGLPVCAVHFKCLHELVQHNRNGMVFHDASELHQQICQLLTGFPRSSSKLENLRENVKEFSKLRWDECWQKDVKPIFTQ